MPVSAYKTNPYANKYERNFEIRVPIAMQRSSRGKCQEKKIPQSFQAKPVMDKSKTDREREQRLCVVLFIASRVCLCLC